MEFVAQIFLGVFLANIMTMFVIYSFWKTNTPEKADNPSFPAVLGLVLPAMFTILSVIIVSG